MTDLSTQIRTILNPCDDVGVIVSGDAHGRAEQHFGPERDSQPSAVPATSDPSSPLVLAGLLALRLKLAVVLLEKGAEVLCVL